MDPVNPTPHTVLDPNGLTETLRWPLLVRTAELACVMVDENGETYTLTTRVQFKDDDQDIVIIERNKVDAQLNQIINLANPAVYTIEIKGELVPEEDHTVYRIELGDPREQ